MTEVVVVALSLLLLPLAFTNCAMGKKVEIIMAAVHRMRAPASGAAAVTVDAAFSLPLRLCKSLTPTCKCRGADLEIGQRPLSQSH